MEGERLDCRRRRLNRQYVLGQPTVSGKADQNATTRASFSQAAAGHKDRQVRLLEMDIVDVDGEVGTAAF